MEIKQQGLFSSCRPTEFFSNVIIGGGLSIWDRDGVEFHDKIIINLVYKTCFSSQPVL